MRVLAFGPHPDDVEFYCSGTLAKYHAQGHTIGIAVMTRGDVGSPTLTRDEIGAQRESEARQSAALLGAELYWLGYDDEFLYDSPDVRRHVIDVIRQFGPDLVLCPDKDNDYLPDHTRTGQIVWDTHVMATVPLIATAHPPVAKPHAIWFYDTISMLNFNPEVWIDISEVWATKVKALACHDSQNAWLKHVFGMTMMDNAELQGRMRGLQAGCRYAEAFRRVRLYPQSVDTNALLPA
jgi:LmbE family N-acetylglucosaminyl deacetylase